MLNRLRRAHGQLAGVIAMIENGSVRPGRMLAAAASQPVPVGPQNRDDGL